MTITGLEERCPVCKGYHATIYVHCSQCLELVHKDQMPTRAEGRCWRCEVKKLREDVTQLSKLAELIEETNTLKNCPYCGHPVATVYRCDRFLKVQYFVCCNSCAAQGGWSGSRSGAVRNWEMRP